MKSLRIFLWVGVLILLFSCITVWADVPQLMNLQWILRDSAGNPVADGSYSVSFSIYDAATLGNSFWSETQSVSTKAGMFNVSLGSITAFPDTVFDGTSRYLGI